MNEVSAPGANAETEVQAHAEHKSAVSATITWLRDLSLSVLIAIATTPDRSRHSSGTPK